MKKKKVSGKSSSGSELGRQVKLIADIKKELSKVVVGQDGVIDGMLMAVIANGHVLVEGVPGIAKTLLVRSIATVMGCNSSRIQFTVDLLPTDIVGITTLSGSKQQYEVIKGPIFAHFIMADEINRAPPKTQSALLEAMGELQVSIGKKTHMLERPFFVMATENPIESAGTYPLPEAQTDRFLFKLTMNYPKKDEEVRIIEQNIALRSFESYKLRRLMSPAAIIRLQQEALAVKHNERILRYIVNIVDATRFPGDHGITLGKYIHLGGSPRASIYLFIAAKANAVINGSKFITPQNVKNIAHYVLRHRIKLNYKAQVDNVTSDDIINEVLNKVKVP